MVVLWLTNNHSMNLTTRMQICFCPQKHVWQQSGQQKKRSERRRWFHFCLSLEEHPTGIWNHQQLESVAALLTVQGCCGGNRPTQFVYSTILSGMGIAICSEWKNGYGYTICFDGNCMELLYNVIIYILYNILLSNIGTFLNQPKATYRNDRVLGCLGHCSNVVGTCFGMLLVLSLWV